MTGFTREKTKLDAVAERFESREGHFNKAFLATEEEETLAAFRAALGEDLLRDRAAAQGMQRRAIPLPALRQFCRAPGQRALIPNADKDGK